MKACISLKNFLIIVADNQTIIPFSKTRPQLKTETNNTHKKKKQDYSLICLWMQVKVTARIQKFCTCKTTIIQEKHVL